MTDGLLTATGWVVAPRMETIALFASAADAAGDLRLMVRMPSMTP